MPKAEAKKVRGVYEHPKDSGIWWIQYFHKGSRRRERVGRKSDAATLYQKRRTEILQGRKLPELGRRRVPFGTLIDDATKHTKNHKSARDYVSRGELARAEFGDRPAEEITSDEIKEWIEERGCTNATFNRYRDYFSLVFRLAVQSKKLNDNPARFILRKREPEGRYRFLSRVSEKDGEDEYSLVHAKIMKDFPDRLDAFEFSIFSGARLDEQFSLPETECNFQQRQVRFRDTKNGTDRVVPMNSEMYRILRKRVPENRRPKKDVLVFGEKMDFCMRTMRRKKDAKPRVSPSPIWFRDLCEGLGIEDYTWHNNRHTFCSWHAMAGTDMRTLKDLAGHATIETTLRYAHLSPDHKQREGENIVAQKKKILKFPSATKTATG